MIAKAQMYECDNCHELKGYRAFCRNASTGWRPMSTCKVCLDRVLAVRTTKQCATCHETKPLSAFHQDKRQHDRLQSDCKDCQRKKMRESFMQRKYGISQEQYDVLRSALDYLAYFRKKQSA